MTTKTQKWGNSLAIRIPKEFSSSLKLREGSSVSFSISAGSLVIKPIPSIKKTRRPSLKQLLAQITPENKHPVYDWGKPVGKEVW